MMASGQAASPPSPGGSGAGSGLTHHAVSQQRLMLPGTSSSPEAGSQGWSCQCGWGTGQGPSCQHDENCLGEAAALTEPIQKG